MPSQRSHGVLYAVAIPGRTQLACRYTRYQRTGQASNGFGCGASIGSPRCGRCFDCAPPHAWIWVTPRPALAQAHTTKQSAITTATTVAKLLNDGRTSAATRSRPEVSLRRSRISKHRVRALHGACRFVSWLAVPDDRGASDGRCRRAGRPSRGSRAIGGAYVTRQWRPPHGHAAARWLPSPDDLS